MIKPCFLPLVPQLDKRKQLIQRETPSEEEEKHEESKAEKSKEQDLKK